MNWLPESLKITSCILVLSHKGFHSSQCNDAKYSKSRHKNICGTIYSSSMNIHLVLPWPVRLPKCDSQSKTDIYRYHISTFWWSTLFWYLELAFHNLKIRDLGPSEKLKSSILTLLWKAWDHERVWTEFSWKNPDILKWINNWKRKMVKTWSKYGFVHSNFFICFRSISIKKENICC